MTVKAEHVCYNSFRLVTCNMKVNCIEALAFDARVKVEVAMVSVARRGITDSFSGVPSVPILQCVFG